MPIYRKLENFRKIGLKRPANRQQLADLARPHVNPLKGLLQEQWFWKSPVWKRHEGRLFDDAMAKAEALSAVGHCRNYKGTLRQENSQWKN
jgi:hypothetical protein